MQVEEEPTQKEAGQKESSKKNPFKEFLIESVQASFDQKIEVPPK